MSAPIGNDRFRDSFKYFKRKKPPPNLDRILKFSAGPNREIYAVDAHDPGLPHVAGLRQPQDFKIYGLHSVPGFYFIENPFQPGYQRYWVYRCLYSYPLKPHVTNMDPQVKLGMDDNIWELSGGKRTKNNLLDKLRWVTLGYHYDWTNKIYYKEKFTKFPEDLQCFCKYIAAILGFNRFTAEAAITNYYHTDSTLSGHTDHSEFDLQAPLISVSFGQPCIFLLGGPTKETEPVAMYLNSGDVVVMSGECRLSYHAVPKILPTGSLPQCFSLPETDLKDDPSFECGHKNVTQKGTTPAVETTVHKYESCEMIQRKSADISMFTCAKCRSTSNTAVATDSTHTEARNVKCGTCSELSTAADKTAHRESGVTTSSSCDCLHHLATNSVRNLEDTIISVNKHIDSTLRSIDWKMFGSYLVNNRVNMNVRQVFHPGQCWSHVQGNTEHCDRSEGKGEAEQHHETRTDKCDFEHCERPDKKPKLDE